MSDNGIVCFFPATVNRFPDTDQLFAKPHAALQKK